MNGFRDVISNIFSENTKAGSMSGSGGCSPALALTKETGRLAARSRHLMPYAWRGVGHLIPGPNTSHDRIADPFALAGGGARCL